MDESGIKVIPWIAHEAEAARLERANRRIMIIGILLFVALVVTNGGWIWYESQFEEVVISQEGTADGGSDLTLNGVESGIVYNYGGESETED